MMYPYFHEDLAPFTREDKLCHFAPVPIGVLEMGLRPSAVLVYIKLLNRATLSQKCGWYIKAGWVYVSFSIPNLSLESGKGESTVRKNLKILQDRELIFRMQPIANEASWIFLRVPAESVKGQKNLPASAENESLEKPAGYPLFFPNP